MIKVDKEKKALVYFYHITSFTIGSMKKYVREYFGMIYKMNCKRNDN